MCVPYVCKEHSGLVVCRYLQAKNTKPSVFLVYVRNTVDFLWCAVIYRYSCYLARVRKAKAPLWGLFERSEKTTNFLLQPPLTSIVKSALWVNDEASVDRIASMTIRLEQWSPRPLRVDTFWKKIFIQASKWEVMKVNPLRRNDGKP